MMNKAASVFFTLSALTLAASAQVAVHHFTKPSNGIISPGSIAVIEGAGFTEGTYNAPFPFTELPDDLGGVRVAVDGVIAKLWHVEPSRIECIVPLFPIRTAYRFGWKPVEVKLSDGRLLTGWTVVLPVAPGIVEEDRGLLGADEGQLFIRTHPQGLWNVAGTQHVGVIGFEPVPRGATLSLTGTGFHYAQRCVAYLMTDDAWYAVPAKVGAFSLPAMYWLHSISFDLPPQLVGDASVVIYADGQFSNEFSLTIQ